MGSGVFVPAMATGPPRRILDGLSGRLCMFERVCERGLVLRAVRPCGCVAVVVDRKFDRAIRTARLHGLLHFDLRPIDVMVYHGPRGRPRLEGGFLLRCLQQLSRPHLATQRCAWRHNWYTRGTSIPVLSY